MTDRSPSQTKCLNRGRTDFPYWEDAVVAELDDLHRFLKFLLQLHISNELLQLTSLFLVNIQENRTMNALNNLRQVLCTRPNPLSRHRIKKLKHSILIDWTELKYFTSPSTRSIGKSPTIFPLEQWWSTFWFSDIHTDFPFTLFLDAKNSSTESEYLVASLFSIPEVEGSGITYSQAKLVVGQLNYFQFNSSHFFYYNRLKFLWKRNDSPSRW